MRYFSSTHHLLDYVFCLSKDFCCSLFINWSVLVNSES